MFLFYKINQKRHHNRGGMERQGKRYGDVVD